MTAKRQLLSALKEHLKLLSDCLGDLAEPIEARVVGGIAVNYYTGHRMSHDADIQWSHRFALPEDLHLFEVPDPEDPLKSSLIAMDTGFSDSLGLFPPDWQDRAKEESRMGNIIVRIIDPVDLAVSKVGRFSERDREDIRQLAAGGWIDRELFASRAEEALGYFVGDISPLRHNVALATAIISRELDDVPEPP